MPGSIAMGILRRSKIARIFLERVGIFIDAPPPPPPPKKMEVTYQQLESMIYKDVQEDERDDFQPNMIYDVGDSDSQDSVFNYFNPKKINQKNTTQKSANQTKKSGNTMKTVNSTGPKINQLQQAIVQN